jgi:hypothetical protein
MTETFQLKNETSDSFFPKSLAVFLVGNPVLEQVRDTHQNALGDGHGRTLFASSGCDPVVLSRQIAGLLAGNHMRGLD